MFRIDRSRVKLSDISELQANISEVVPAGEAVQAILPEPQERPDELLEQARLEAAELIEQAHREADALRLHAEEILHQAEADSEKVIAEARQLGYELGYNEGNADGEREYLLQAGEMSSALSRVIEELERAQREMLDSLEGDIIDLCFSVVRKVAALDRSSDGELFRSTIKNALGQLDIDAKLTIRLSPEDFARFFPEGEAIFDMGDAKITSAVAEDKQLAPGDIVIDSENETLVAGIETQLKKLELSFKHLIGGSDEKN